MPAFAGTMMTMNVKIDGKSFGSTAGTDTFEYTIEFPTSR